MALRPCCSPVSRKFSQNLEVELWIFLLLAAWFGVFPLSRSCVGCTRTSNVSSTQSFGEMKPRALFGVRPGKGRSVEERVAQGGGTEVALGRPQGREVRRCLPRRRHSQCRPCSQKKCTTPHKHGRRQTRTQKCTKLHVVRARFFFFHETPRMPRILRTVVNAPQRT